jgi:hypothetical protein
LHCSGFRPMSAPSSPASLRLGFSICGVSSGVQGGGRYFIVSVCYSLLKFNHIAGYFSSSMSQLAHLLTQLNVYRGLLTLVIGLATFFRMPPCVPLYQHARKRSLNRSGLLLRPNPGSVPKAGSQNEKR